MKRILVYGISNNIFGGIESFLFSNNDNMSCDIVFDYIIEGSDTLHEKRIKNKNGKIFYICSKKRPFKNISQWKKILRNCKKTYSTIYFNLYSLAWAFPINLALKYGYDVFVHAHNSQLYDCGIVVRILHRINRYLLRKRQFTRLANSTLSSEFFFNNKKAKIIFNGVEVGKFNFDIETSNKIRKELDVGKESKLFGFAGRIVRGKNPLFLIDIFSEINKLLPNSKFIVCGDGPLLTEVKEKADRLGISIIFKKRVENIHEYYMAMDAFILPTLSEGLGIVLVEAQASGLPCITSKYVVPFSTNITNSVNYVELGKDKKIWAMESIKVFNEVSERKRINHIVEDSDFNIKKSSIYLEHLLLNELEKKPTIGVVTFFGRNYGGFLQAFALQKYLIRNGFDPSLIYYNYYKDNTIFGVDKNLLKKSKKQFFFKLLISVLNFKKNKQSEKSFRRCIDKYLITTHIYKNYNELKNKPPVFDIYLTGSDQVFNCNINSQGWDSRLLKFANHGLKVSYAASSGSNEMRSEGSLLDLKNESANFQLLSVREKEFAKYLEEKLSREVYYHIDPVYLLDEKEWLEFADFEGIPDQDYIFVYYVNNKMSTIQRAVDLSIKTGLPLLFVKNHSSVNVPQIKHRGTYGPDKWVAAIMKSKYVVTNSFHALSFSLIFKKNVVIAKVDSGFERIKDILKSTNLEDLYDSNIPKLSSTDFCAFNDYLDEQKTKADLYFSAIKKMVDKNE